LGKNLGFSIWMYLPPIGPEIGQPGAKVKVSHHYLPDQDPYQYQDKHAATDPHAGDIKTIKTGCFASASPQPR
jgi:hypothetical protein